MQVTILTARATTLTAPLTMLNLFFSSRDSPVREHLHNAQPTDLCKHIRYAVRLLGLLLNFVLY